MFSIFKSAPVHFPLGELLHTDMHSHILPGIDDGAKDLESSLKLIGGLKSIGYQQFIATPHIYAEVHPNTAASISAAYERLKEEVERQQLEVPIRYAAEYMLDEQFEAKLGNEALLPLQGDLVLVETMFFSELPNFSNVLFKIQTAGYKPVIAHPERYHFMFGNLAKAEDLKSRGALLQVNALSLTGYYGKYEKQTALSLLEAGLVDLIGTDLHHDRHLQKLLNYKIDRKMRRMLENAPLLNSSLCLQRS
ncbi:tyrosine-protein phosphatase [Olivibacter sp. XZL3]|uniref:tyrosine-protein phosphatase n=1 Tax=Olivibacter sp. XZL3 TaxID=1735116 RepID=UPI0010646B7C|nr:CpsB/CapC family capsule biosynthesis tyrosine phosphatase [Olivibacter sp. XZL3]